MKNILSILFVFVYAASYSQSPAAINPFAYADIRQFGAVGDSVTDCTAPIQNAINSLMPTSGVTVGGGVVMIPAGRWKITGKITIPDRTPIKFIGAGAFNNNTFAGLASDARYGPSTIFYTSTSDTAFMVRANGTSFHDLTIYCPNASSTTTNVGIYVDSGNNFAMNRVNLMNFNVNFWYRHGVFFHVDDCTFRNGHTYGAVLQSYDGVDAGDSRIHHSLFATDNAASANDTLLKIINGGGLMVDHCKFAGGAIPIYAPYQGSSDIHFDNNSIELFSGGTAIWVVVQSTKQYYNSHIVGNQIVGSGQAPIIILDASAAGAGTALYNTLIDDNIFVGNLTDTAIYFKGGNVIVPNVVGAGNIFHHILVPVVSPLSTGAYLTSLSLGKAQNNNWPSIDISTDGSDFSSGLIMERHNTSALAPSALFQRSAGTATTPSVVSNQDPLGITFYAGYDGSFYRQAGSAGMYVDSAVSSASVPTGWFLHTGKATDQSPVGSAHIVLNVDHNGRMGLGFNQPKDTALFTIGGAFSTMNNGAKGNIFSIRPMTITNWSGAATTTMYAGTSIGIPTFAGNATDTYTNAATVYVDGAPAAGSNVTITNPWSLYVNSGSSFFGGSVQIKDGTQSSGYIFTSDANGVGSWQPNSGGGGGMTNPLTTTGDIIYSSSGTTPARLGIGSTNQVLTVISGIPSWQTPSNGSPGGSTTNVQINDGGSFYGDAGMTYDKTNKIFAITHTLGTGVVGDGLELTNGGAAVNSGQQYSPFLTLTGAGFATTPAASQVVNFRMGVIPVQGAANPTGNLTVQSQVNGAGFNSIWSLNTAGFMVVGSGAQINSGLLNVGGITNINGNLFINSSSSSTGAKFQNASGNEYLDVLASGEGFNIRTNALGLSAMHLDGGNGGAATFGSLSNQGFAQVEAVKTTGAQFSAVYNGSNHTEFTTNSSGNLAIVPSGGTTTITGNLTLGTAGNALNITEGTNGRVGQTVLVSGTKAITITGLTTSSRAFVTLVSPSGGSLTIQYQAVCTSNTLTLQANVAAGTINTADGSTLNYFVIN